jgi:hypothetical protein
MKKRVSAILLIMIIMTLPAMALESDSTGVTSKQATDLQNTNAVTSEPSCSDSDGGIDYYTSSVLTLPNTEKIEERCYDGNTLLELSCTDQQGNSICTDSGCEMIRVTCEYGCKNAACIKDVRCSNQADIATCLDVEYCYWDQQFNKCQDIANKQKCYDSDSGKEYTIQANAFGFKASATDNTDARIRTGVKDECLSDATLTEHFCTDTYNIDTMNYNCSNGCENGACKSDIPDSCGDGTCQPEERKLICEEECQLACPKDCSTECEPTYYTCPDGAQVLNCKCNEYGDHVCILNPQNQCSTCGDAVCSAEETYTCSSDCDPFQDYLITKDIATYKFNYATKDSQWGEDYGQVIQYQATYRLDSLDIKVVVIELTDRENAEKAFRDEVLQEGYSISYIINNAVYIINDDFMAWMNQNKIIIVNHLRKNYNIVTEPVEEANLPPITANVAKYMTNNVVENAIEIPLAEVNVNYKERLERINDRIGQVTENKENPPHVIPTPLVIGYLKLHPSDFLAEPLCGNEICEYNEWKECKKDCAQCPKTPIIDPNNIRGCIQNNGKWIESEELNGCPIPPYCVYKQGNDITELKKTAILMKLSGLKTKVNNLRNKALGLASYNMEQGSQIKAVMWQSAADEFQLLIDKISSIQKEIKDMDTEDIKAALKWDISQIKLNIGSIVNYIIEQHKANALEVT